MLHLRYRLEVLAYRVVLGLSRIIPRRAMQFLGSLGGMLGYLLDRRHRRITLANLTAALGDELDATSIRRTARACWRHFGRITVDSLYFPRITAESIRRDVEFVGEDHFLRAWNRGKGVLVVSGHFGHWELGAYGWGLMGFKFALIARPLSNPLLEPLLAGLRTGSGNRVVLKRNAIRESVKALRSGACVAIMIDQDARGRGVFVPFFGRLASTTPALVQLALRTGAAIVPSYCEPLGAGKYRFVAEREVVIQHDADRRAEVLRVTAECTAILERWVRQRPDLWLWMHRRWKTRPETEANPSSSANRAPSEESQWA